MQSGQRLPQPALPVQRRLGEHRLDKWRGVATGKMARTLPGESDARTRLRHRSGAPRRRPSASVTSASTEI
jgi:hypothetical protein